MYDVSTEIIRSYADMRYELNKLSLLSHPHIVRFIGVLTNPHSFVLEWAPMKSLEHIRASHGNSHTPLCASSIFQVLVQVSPQLPLVSLSYVTEPSPQQSQDSEPLALLCYHILFRNERVIYTLTIYHNLPLQRDTFCIPVGDKCSHVSAL